MLTIRKRGFERQSCFCCSGEKTYLCDPKHSLVKDLYHKSPDPDTCYRCQVLIPRCKRCANKLRSIIPISILWGIICAITGYFYTICAHSVGSSLFVGLIFGGIGYYATYLIMGYAFRIVYGQNTSNYEVTDVLKNRFGWTDSAPKQGETDNRFTEDEFENMLGFLGRNYSCEWGDL